MTNQNVATCNRCKAKVYASEVLVEWSIFDSEDLFMGYIELVCECGHCSSFNGLEHQTDIEDFGAKFAHTSVHIEEIDHFNEHGLSLGIVFQHMDTYHADPTNPDWIQLGGWEKVQRQLLDLGVVYGEALFPEEIRHHEYVGELPLNAVLHPEVEHSELHPEHHHSGGLVYVRPSSKVTALK